MIDMIPTPDLIEPENSNVADSVLDHAQSLTIERTNDFLVYDPLATISLHQYFDGLITAPHGLYQGQPFMAVSRNTTSLAEFVGWLIRTHDADVKLLYMVQKFEPPMLVDFDHEPLTHCVRFAIINR